MLKATISRRRRPVKTFSLSRPAVADASGLTDRPVETSIRVARRIVREWTGFFALSLPINEAGHLVTFDVKKAAFLRCLRQAARRYTSVLLSETFGTLTLGQ